MILNIKNIDFSYSEKNIIQDLSLRYDSKKTMCILGANGTGKSTLLKCIMGENKIQKGQILINDEDLLALNPRERARKIAYIPQNHHPSFAFKVIDVVLMGRTSKMGYFATPSKQDTAIAMDYLDYLGIAPLAQKAYTDISGGERQLVMIASALSQEPEMLLLDEPTAHLDFGNQYRFLELVKKLQKEGIGICMTTHFPDHALQLQSETALMNHGKIVETGTAKDIITEDKLRKIYGIEIHVENIGHRRVCVPGEI
ncbi:MAG: ABC transporter ATP-binding protein [Tissierellia bacterium]|nr:ABC transporter ATP-binding protein [Tissierellia bacterium]